MTAKDTVDRIRVARARRIVVKVGSSSLASDEAVFARLAKTARYLRDEGRSLVIVSSGAIALGVRKLGYKSRPREIGKLQAAAAAGQSLLMRAYEEAFRNETISVAQVLLTHADLAHRARANNAREALQALLEASAVPILNENDSVAVEEIRFGDNDQLASMVVPLVEADLLVLLSDVDGLLDQEGRRVPVVRDLQREALVHVRSSKSAAGTGGMESKLEAARWAMRAGASVVIANAHSKDALGSLLRGDDTGTLFVPATDRFPAKKAWIAFTLRPKGDLVLDRGAAEAVEARGKSVLSVGVLGVRGDFRATDPVRILDPDGREIARGLVRFASVECAVVAGKNKDELSGELKDRRILVHRDDLVLVNF